MLVGLWTMGSEAQRVASRPSADLTFRADSSGLTWAWPVVEQARDLVAQQITTLERVETSQTGMTEAGEFSGLVRSLRSAQTRTALEWLRSLADG